MMNDPRVSWLVEDGPFEEDIDPLLKEIKRQGHILHTVKYHPFESGEYKHLFSADACVIFYGSINLATQLQRQTPWVPGPIVTWPAYDCSTYYAYFGKYLFNRDYVLLPYAEAKRYVDEPPESGSVIGYNFFLRPNSGRKSFGGHTVCKTDFLRPEGPVPDAKPEDLVIMAPNAKISREWRLIICDGKVIAGSQYMSNHRLELNTMVPISVWEYAQSILNSTEWRPDRVFCMDIAEREMDQSLGLLEINAFSTSGLYAANPEPIVREITRVAREEWDDVYKI